MFENLLNKYSLKIDSNLIPKFELFLKLFLEKNSVVNLSSLREEKDILEKHFIDSLILTKFTKLNGKIADLGTGGGFPGIPLAMIYEKANFDLIDSVGKKIKAVEEFKENLGLKNIKGTAGRFEDLGQDPNFREKYDFVVSRATAYLPVLLEYSIPFLKKEGLLIAYKSDNDAEIKEAKVALMKLESEIIRIEKYDLCGQKRVLIFIKKISRTNNLYPRNNGIPLKKPLI